MTDYRKDDKHPRFGSRWSAEDFALAEALQNVPVPDALESQLLTTLAANQRSCTPRAIQKDRSRFGSRRAWLATAAALAGTATAGPFLYRHRKLRRNAVIEGIDAALASEQWVVPWSLMGNAPNLPLPRSLRMPKGWQYIETIWGEESVAFDLTLAGGPPSVLFAVPSCRDLSEFAPAPPPLPPRHLGEWKRIAIWQNAPVLFVLASQGTSRDYASLFLHASRSSIV